MSHFTNSGKQVSFETLPKVLAHSDKIALLLHTHQVGNKFGKNPIHVQIIFQISLNWSKWNSQHVSNLTDSHFWVCKATAHHSIHILICFAHQWTSQVFGIFVPCKTTIKHMFFPCLLSQSYFQHFKSPCSIFPQYQAQFDTDMLFFRYVKINNGKTFVLNNTLLKNYMWYSLFLSRKCLQRPYYIYIDWQKFMFNSSAILQSVQKIDRIT